jgi:CheY-like chemotaxis protein
MDVTGIVEFIQANKAYFDAAQAVSVIVNLLGWTLGGVLLFIAWRRNRIRSFTVGPINFQMQEAAVEAAAVAARDWQAKTPAQRVDVGRLRAAIEPAFEPETSDALVGKSILWVDDNPGNNALVLRALQRLRLDVVQETSTEAGLAAMAKRHFDLVISDMGRGDNLRAGYDLLAAVRDRDPKLPFLIFSGADKPEFRREAKARGAQLSTNDVIELIDTIVRVLGRT